MAARIERFPRTVQVCKQWYGVGGANGGANGGARVGCELVGFLGQLKYASNVMVLVEQGLDV